MSDTREKILSTSLDLFSHYGYEAVSIRDISSKVGIKESSIYYHFASKQAIFEELLDRFENMAADMMAQLEQAISVGSGMDKDGLGSVCSHFFDGYLMEPYCNSVLRLLTMEQYHSAKARSLYRRWLFDEPLGFQTRIFAQLLPGRKSEAGYIAVKFYAPIYLYSQRWLLCGTLSEGDKASFRADAYRHVRSFSSELEAGNG